MNHQVFKNLDPSVYREDVVVYAYSVTSVLYWDKDMTLGITRDELHDLFNRGMVISYIVGDGSQITEYRALTYMCDGDVGCVETLDGEEFYYFYSCERAPK